jgi:phenylalanine-4-hydroxylase
VDCGIRLIGTVENPKIYGAGLFVFYWRKRPLHDGSSGEFPYDITAIKFDITSCNLNFITPTFAYLNLVLEEFANKMALRTGGLSGIKN